MRRGVLGLVVVGLNVRVGDVLDLQFILDPLEHLARRNVHGILNLYLQNQVGSTTQIQPQVDAGVEVGRVVLFGHSRLGKAAVWAAATDPRFAGVISNESGCGGVAILRNKQGETVAKITQAFPNWFCANFNRFAGRESEMPTDQHEMVALVAPRPVYIGSAEEDLWSDPFNEFACAVLADPVWRLLGSDGFGVKDMPALNTSVGRTIRYHNRSGKHGVTAYDWEEYLRFVGEEVEGKGVR